LGWSESEIAKKTGKPLAHVKNCLVLASGSTEIHSAIALQKISATTAVAAIRSSATEEQATQAVQGAIAIAEKEGKEKAQKKHLEQAQGAGRQTFAKLAKQVLAQTVPRYDGDDNDRVVLELSSAEYEELMGFIRKSK
jgi:ParB-like chromosome segregation protein Spo0J